MFESLLFVALMVIMVSYVMHRFGGGGPRAR